MKTKLYTILSAFLITAATLAQAPEKMSYQAVVRDAGNTIVSNQAVGMQISVLQTTAAGTSVYVETQTPSTNANGLISIEIGMGNAVSGDFSAIDWSAGPYFVKTETDPTGGTSYTITGTSELLSVPYALHAKTADNLSNEITELASFRLGNNSQIMSNSTNYVQLGNSGVFSFNPHIFELQNSGNYGVKINKDGFLSVTISQSVRTTNNSSAYLSIEVLQNDNVVGVGLIGGTSGNWGSINLSVPIKVFENDVITMRFVENGANIIFLSNWPYSVYSFSWSQN